MGLSQTILKDEDRQKLDGIVTQMQNNNEPEENIRFVVDDFKQKYGQKKNGGSESPSVPPSTSEVKDIFSKVRQLAPEQKQGAMPTVHGLTQVHKLSSNEVNQEAKTRLANPYNKIFNDAHSNDPIGALKQVTKQQNDEILQDPESPFNVHSQNELAINNQMAKLAEDNAFSNSQEAKQWLQRNPNSADTETGKLANQKIQDAQSTNDLLSKYPIEEAAVRKNNNLTDADTYYSFIKKNNAKAGQDVKDFLQDPEVIAKAQADPEFAKQYQVAKDNWYNHFPEAATAEVRQQLGQARDKSGQNAWFYNNPGKETTDALAANVLNPQQKLIYDKHVAPLLDHSPFSRMLSSVVNGQTIPTSDLVNSTVRGVGTGLENIEKTMRSVDNTVTGGTLKDAGLLENDADKVNRLNNEEAGQPQVEEKGAGAIGNFTGQFIPMIATGAVMKGLGLAEGTADVANMAFNFEGSNAEKALRDHPDNKAAQLLQTGLGTLGDTFLTKLLPVGKISTALRNEFAGETKSIVSDLTSGAITANEAKNKLYQKFIDLTKGTIKNSFQTANILTAYDAFHQGLDAVMGNNNDITGGIQKDINSYTTKLLSSSFLSGVSALAELHPKVKGEQIRQMANDPDFENKVQNSDLSTTQKDDVIQNWKNAQSILKNELDKNNKLTQAQKDKYLINALAQSVHEKNAAEAKSGGSKAIATEAAQQAEQVQKDILTGKDAAPEHQNIAPVEEEKPAVAPELEKARTELQNTLADPEKSKKLGMYAELAKDNPDAVIKDIAEQAHGITQDGSELTGGSREADMNKNYPELVQAAKEAFPKESYPEPANYTPEEKAKQVMSDYGKLPAESRKTNVTYDGIDGTPKTKTARDATVELRARYQLLKDVMENCL